MPALSIAAPAAKRMPATAKFGLAVVALFGLIALFAPLLTPYGETQIVGAEYAPWTAKHWLGTDNLGRDMATRLIFGARNTIGIATITTVLAFLMGGTLGMVAGTMRGWVDQVLGRIVDILMAVPSLIFTLLLLAIFGTSIFSMIGVIAGVEATRVFRLARSLALGIGVLDYVEAARLRGERLGWLIGREILPNATAPLIAEFGLRFCFVFLFVASLSFLGLGIQPPTADWGSMVRENAALITYGDVTPLLPAGCTALMTVAVNFIVDWMLHRSSGLKD
jgi:peptide/nickel transport system permease protein